MDAILYTRVSKDVSGRSTSEQESECRDECARNGWNVVQVFTDNDIGASRWSKKDRPAYRNLKQALRPGMVLVTWEASRAQRDLKLYVELRDLCAELGVLWSYSGTIYDLNNGDDRFRTGLDALLSENEVEKTRDRVRRTVRAQAAAGRPHGKLPFGYRLVRDPVTGKPIAREIDEAQAAIVREAVRRVLAGESLYAVAKDFTARGYYSPRPNRQGELQPWNPSTMRSLIASPTYAGLRLFQGQVIGPATWPAIVSMEDHEKLKTLFADPSRMTRTGDSRAKYLLSGIAKCGVCGTVVRRINNRSKYGTYICSKGFCVARTIEGVDTLVTEAVIHRLSSPDLERLFVASDTALDRDLAEALERARLLRDRLNGFYEAAADGDLTPAALARIESKLLPQIEAAKADTKRHYRSPLIAELAGLDAREKWEALSLERQREAITSLVQVRLLRTGKSHRFKPESVEITFL